MAKVIVGDISRMNWHLVGALGSILCQCLMLLAAVTVGPGLALAGWLWFPTSIVVVCVFYLLVREHRSPAWWMIWPVVSIARMFVFGLGAPAAAQLTTGLLTIFFLYAGLTQPQGRSLLLLPPALLVLRGIIDLPLHLALVRLVIAAIVFSMASELPAFLLRRLSQQQQLLASFAHTDSLTGARNRRGLDELLETMQGRAYLVIVDLDQFKGYNDARGHQAGDALLVDFVAMLHRETRRDDVVVRYGGEEFLVVLAGADRPHAESVVDRWATVWADHPSGVTFSAGVTDLLGDDAVHRADTSLYTAKTSGRARAVFSPSAPAVALPG